MSTRVALSQTSNFSTASAKKQEKQPHPATEIFAKTKENNDNQPALINCDFAARRIRGEGQFQDACESFARYIDKYLILGIVPNGEKEKKDSVLKPFCETVDKTTNLFEDFKSFWETLKSQGTKYSGTLIQVIDREACLIYSASFGNEVDTTLYNQVGLNLIKESVVLPNSSEIDVKPIGNAKYLLTTTAKVSKSFVPDDFLMSVDLRDNVISILNLSAKLPENKNSDMSAVLVKFSDHP